MFIINFLQKIVTNLNYNYNKKINRIRNWLIYFKENITIVIVIKRKNYNAFRNYFLCKLIFITVLFAIYQRHSSSRSWRSRFSALSVFFFFLTYYSIHHTRTALEIHRFMHHIDWSHVMNELSIVYTCKMFRKNHVKL